MDKPQTSIPTHEDETLSILVSPNTNTLQIVNLSDYVSSRDEVAVLQKGLTFSPMAQLDKFVMVKDLYFFCRNLTLKMLYTRSPSLDVIEESERQIFQDLLKLLQENEGVKETGKPKFKRKSKVMPPLTLSPAIQTFYNVTCRDIMKLREDRNTARNALIKLQQNKMFVIKEADKGGNVVIWPVNMYLSVSTTK